MLKKTLALIAPVAAVVGIAMVPAAASGYYHCYPGTPTHSTPVCEQVCKVPSVVGLKLHAVAVPLIHVNDCRVKTIFPRLNKHRTLRRIIVTKQNLATGGFYGFGQKITVHVKYVYKPST